MSLNFDIRLKQIWKYPKEFESLPQTWILQSLYLVNLRTKTFDISNFAFWSRRIHILKYLRSTTLGWKDIEIRKSEFVAKIQLLYGMTFNV